MAQELSYVLITPYSLQKSRTGGILARLLSRTDIELVGTQMLAPTKEFVEKYIQIIKEIAHGEDKTIVDLLCNYIQENFVPNHGKYQRIMLLLFKGEDAIRKLKHVIGKLKPGVRTGETIRDTYSDYVLNHDGSLRYFEPAVITIPNSKDVKKNLKVFADFILTQPNIIDKPLDDCDDSTRTLVIIKPDNWKHPSSRPGNIIDMLSKTGLRIVGCKLYKMSVGEALEFYGPVMDALRAKLAPHIGQKSKELLEKEFNIEFSDSVTKFLIPVVGYEFADGQFEQLVEFMSGVNPRQCEKKDFDVPGKVKCMVLIYQGENAIEKIREVLGPTDPSKAPGGTIRRDFGRDIMVNTAHASDSYENAKREMKIVKIEKNEIASIINEYLK